ncbi:hypothetical protein QOT17_012102 [Balamuthia mandrillaris]
MGFLKGGRGGGLWRSLKGFSLFPSPLAEELQKMKVTEQLLFTFNTQEDLNKWRFSSDARFGGCTTGRFFLTDAKTARLEGTLSQEIKPGSKLVESGFATILPVKNMRDIFLDGFDSVEVRLKTVRCFYILFSLSLSLSLSCVVILLFFLLFQPQIKTKDGREWAMNMQCYEQSEDGFFQIYFTTPKDQWFTLLVRFLYNVPLPLFIIPYVPFVSSFSSSSSCCGSSSSIHFSFIITYMLSFFLVLLRLSFYLFFFPYPCFTLC